MSSAFYSHHEIISCFNIIHRQLVIFARDLSQASFDPLEGKLTILCADTISLNDLHVTMLTDSRLACVALPTLNGSSP